MYAVVDSLEKLNLGKVGTGAETNDDERDS